MSTGRCRVVSHDLTESHTGLCDLMQVFSCCRVATAEMELPNWKAEIILHSSFLLRDNK